MALITEKFNLPDGSVIPEAYIRVQNIVTENVDYEVIENIEGSDDQRVSWKSEINSFANVYVWADNIARENRARPIHWFKIDFTYDINSDRNVYSQAYDSLKMMFESSKDV